jgi:putative NADH-flavin reductase
LLRTAESLPVQHARLVRIIGSLEQTAQVRAVVEGADAVVSVLGARKGGSATICSDGIESVLSAMEGVGTRRLIALSAYGAAETSQASWFIRFVRSVIGEKMRDKDSMESLVRASNTGWTLVRPPVLTNGKATGRFRSGIDMRPTMTGHLSRDDLAAFILGVAEGATFIRQAPVVSM